MLRRSYTAKPPPGTPIIPGHPLAQGLMANWTMSEGGGLYVYDSSGRNNKGTLVNGPLWVPGRSGLTLSFDGSDDYVDFGNFQPASDAITIMVWVNILTHANARAQSNEFLAKGYGGSSPWVSFTLGEIDSGGNQPRFGIAINGSLNWSNMTGVFTATDWNLWIGRWKNGVGINIRIYSQSGSILFDQTSSASSGTITYGTESITLARGRSGDPHYPNAKISDPIIYNKYLRDDEISWFFLNPYAMFEQPRRGKWFFVAAGGETRNLPASIVGASVTPEISATNVRALLSGITGASLTSDITATTVRSLLANILSASSTPDIIALITRSLLATIAAESVTSSAVATTARSLLANIQAVSLTPDITQTIIRNILANVSVSSLTSDISAITARALAANIIAGSYTPDITATMEGVINLIATITGSSLTPDITVIILRQLGASISAQSITSDALVTIVRNLLASIFNTSVTPDNLICTFLGLSIRQQILDKIQTRFEGITASGSDSIRQKVMDAVDARLKTIS